MNVTIPGNGWRRNRYSVNGGKGPVNGEGIPSPVGKRWLIATINCDD
jgi:hypothetical protein